MIKENSSSTPRKNRVINLETEFLVTGGGLAGICASITAARNGAKVVLIQDRPVLGGNASSEVRLWALGATSHMGNNNRWAREGGVIDEILVENRYRNKEGNPIVFDTILLEKVTSEENITLLLNTSVYEVRKSSENTIESVMAYCSQNSTIYKVDSNLFCDASGDGVLAFGAGASFRMGAEKPDELGELLAPPAEYGELLGHTLYFYSKDTGKPVDYVAPSYALKDITKIPQFKRIKTNQRGCDFWWFEYGGSKDTIYDTESIKWELWKIVYGVWDYIKNSGEFPESRNLTLEWVGTIPGKRESRRFEGLYMLRQQDLIEQKEFEDAVAYGGWALDLHPVDSIYKNIPSCDQWHCKGVYQIPYRCYLSRTIDNLFLAGRIISVSHVAFSSTRIMLTCAAGGQVTGMAAAKCIKKHCLPKDILEKERMIEFQEDLNLQGQSIPRLPMRGLENLLHSASITLSSQLSLTELSHNGKWLKLNNPTGQMIPLEPLKYYRLELPIKTDKECRLRVDIRVSKHPSNHTPERTLLSETVLLSQGEQTISLELDTPITETQYAFICFEMNEHVSIAQSDTRLTGVVSVFQTTNTRVNNLGMQTPPEGIGIESFEFWIPKRYPEGKNLALKITPPLECFGVDSLLNGYTRPTQATNAWISDFNDANPHITLTWEEKRYIKEITLFFDPDYDHPLESVQWGHPTRISPFCVRKYRIVNDDGTVLHSEENNHQGVNRIKLSTPVETQCIHIELDHPNDLIPSSLFYLDIR